MRVDRRIAVPREMLADRGNSCGQKALHRLGSQCLNQGRVAAERADADDRVVRVVVHIQNRSEVHVDARGSHLYAGGTGYLECELGVTRGAEGHGPGHEGKSPVQPDHRTAFLVNGYEEGQVPTRSGHILECLRQGGRFGDRARVSGKVDDAPYLKVTDGYCGALRVFSRKSHHEDLSHLLPEREVSDFHLRKIFILRGCGHVGFAYLSPKDGRCLFLGVVTSLPPALHRSGDGVRKSRPQADVLVTLTSGMHPVGE